MDGMGDMSMMGGMGMDMDSASSELFVGENKSIAMAYWYSIAAVVGLLAVLRLILFSQKLLRMRLSRRSQHLVPSRPQDPISQAFATATATVRELIYSQPVVFTGQFSKYFTPLPVGHWLLLAVYWAGILICLWTDVILSPDDPMYAYKWEKVGFRAAWVSVAQIPFIYLLSCKFSPISIVAGLSYERLNWFHRWAARTVFLTVIVHWTFFFQEWTLANFVQFELQLMPMVKYGFGAWAVIGWMILSGFGFFRNMSYEIFVLQHLAAAATLLWLLYVHVPSYAQYNIFLAIGFIAFDWSLRIICIFLRNIHILGKVSIRTPGYSAQLEVLGEDMARLRIDDADFTWRPGQHVHICVPRLRPFELHPFTIANASQQLRKTRQHQSLTLVIKARAGFSKALFTAAVKSEGRTQTYRTLLSGPWGNPPDLTHYETVVLIATSSGASFTVPLLENLVMKTTCVKKLRMHWIIKKNADFSWFGEVLTRVKQIARDNDLDLSILVHITRSEGESDGIDVWNTSQTPDHSAQDKKTATVETCSLPDSASGAKPASFQSESEISSRPLVHKHASLNVRHGLRPTAESMIRSPVEEACGETAVVVCGGAEITAQIRTFVARLSDERATHKGTGAQGIFLFTESYGW